jgi:hypothetical protein
LNLNICLKATVCAGVPEVTRGKAPDVNRALNIQIGNACCTLRCPDDEIYQGLDNLYRHFLTDQATDVTIQLERSDRDVAAGGNGNTEEEPYFAVLCDEPDLFVAEMECSLGRSGNGFRYMNRLFYMAYYTACLEKYGGGTPGMLVHACGILRRGRAFVFAGPSESGKSTIAGLCGEEDGRVISDEMVLIARPGPDGGASVQSVPIIGEFPPRLNIAVPLSCILLLKRGERTRICPINPVDAYLRLISQTIKPCYVGQRGSELMLPLLADFSQETTNSVPVYELEFTIDRESLWQEISNLETVLYGRVS